MSEHDQFLKDLDNDQAKGVDILEQPLNDEAAKPSDNVEVPDSVVVDDEDDDDDLKPKNRRERRLMRKLQSERESSMFLAGKLEARSEAERILTEEADYLKGIERIYGTETPEAQLATDLLKKAITGARDDAKREAIEELRTERLREIEEEAQAQRELDSYIEDIEDTYGVNLTDVQERSFFQLLQKMSPKDSDGNVVEYADPHAVWEVFQERLQKRGTDNRAKSLSARSMVQSGASKESSIADDSAARFLKDSGII